MILGPRHRDGHDRCVTSCLLLLSSLWTSLVFATAEVSPSPSLPNNLTMTILDELESSLWEGSGIHSLSASFARDEEDVTVSSIVSWSSVTALHPSFVSQIHTTGVHPFSHLPLMIDSSETANLATSPIEHGSNSRHFSLTETDLEHLKETSFEFESSRSTISSLSLSIEDISFSPYIAYATTSSSALSLALVASSEGNEISSHAIPILTTSSSSTEISPSTSSSPTDVSFAVHEVTSSASPASNESTETHFSLILKADDCLDLDKVQLEQELYRLLSKATVLAKGNSITVDRCSSEINVNVTVSDELGKLKSLTDDAPRNNLTLLFHNRTFHIVQIQRLVAESGTNITSLNSTITTITVVTKNEFSAYVAVGVSFGLVLIVCISVCCAKCCIKRPPKTLGVSRSPQMHLRLEDYTLTPLPRPGALYVDYYRGSLAGDLYATTPVGSVSSTPTVEQGVVQPFDTSIVPLEDSVQSDEVPRRASVESNALPPNMRSFDVHTIADHGFIYCTTRSESKERLHAKVHHAPEVKSIGVSNPVFQKF